MDDEIKPVLDGVLLLLVDDDDGFKRLGRFKRFRSNHEYNSIGIDRTSVLDR